jgi:hypothetical protein
MSYNLQNLNICPRFLSISHIYKQKALQMFCVTTNECDNDSKEWCFLLKQMVTKKNVWHKQKCD